MSFENFVETVEAKQILEVKQPKLLWGNFCKSEYNMGALDAGDKVKIIVKGTATVYITKKNGTYSAGGNDELGVAMTGSKAGKGKDILQEGIPNADALDTTELNLEVNMIATFNKMVGDYDKALSSKKNLLGMIRESVGERLAKEEDKYISQTVLGYEKSTFKATGYTDNTTIAVSGDTDTTSNKLNIIELCDLVLEKFSEVDVGDEAEIVCLGSPSWNRVARQAVRKIDTDNSDTIRGRKSINVDGIHFVTTNNCKTASGVKKVCFMTTDSVAFFAPYLHTEAYRPEKGFSDCLKGFEIFDCAIVRPNEVFVLTEKLS